MLAGMRNTGAGLLLIINSMFLQENIADIIYNIGVGKNFLNRASTLQKLSPSIKRWKWGDQLSWVLAVMTSQEEAVIVLKRS